MNYYGTCKSDEIFVTSELSNIVYGRNGNDRLLDIKTSFTSASDDTLIGGRGNDILYSSDGMDILRGGKGDDFFVIEPGVSTAYVIGGKGEDSLRLFDLDDRRVEIRDNLIEVFDIDGVLVQTIHLVDVEHFPF